MKHKRICKNPNCQRKFFGRTTKRFCSEDCRIEFWKKKHKKSKKSKGYFKEKCSFKDCNQKGVGLCNKKVLCPSHYKIIRLQRVNSWRKIK